MACAKCLPPVVFAVTCVDQRLIESRWPVGDVVGYPEYSKDRRVCAIVGEFRIDGAVAVEEGRECLCPPLRDSEGSAAQDEQNGKTRPTADLEQAV